MSLLITPWPLTVSTGCTDQHMTLRVRLRNDYKVMPSIGRSHANCRGFLVLSSWLSILCTWSSILVAFARRVGSAGLANHVASQQLQSVQLQHHQKSRYYTQTPCRWNHRVHTQRSFSCQRALQATKCPMKTDASPVTHRNIRNCFGGWEL